MATGRATTSVKRLLTTGFALATIGVLSGCSDPAEQSMCAKYDEAAESLRDLADLSLEDTTAGEAHDAVEAAIGRVRALDAAADTRHRNQLDQLESALDDLLRVLSSVDDDADSATWEPLVVDSAEDVRDAADVVARRVGTECAVAD